ncbi:MAG: response regulator, partial [Gammaproteobacteria bacterium]|nr:response regulator [Gammaproteobacteria bacterium]
SAIDGLKILERERIDVVVSDMRMPKMSGSDFLAEVKRCWADTIRILLTGYDDAGPIIQAVNSGEIFRYVYKPWNDGELELAVEEGLSRHYAEEERKRLVDLLHIQNMELRNKTSALQKALEEIETLKGIIPICSYCHQIRDDEGLWSQLELYLSKHSLADFSHGVCPDCYEKEVDKIMSSNKSM